MTGSGKTGLVTVLVEEALGAGIPTIIIDVKGDLPNLLLTFPNLDPGIIQPWVEAGGEADPANNNATAAKRSEERQQGVVAAGISEADLQHFVDTTSVRVIHSRCHCG